MKIIITLVVILLVAAALVGTGSSVFHPESSRVARMASGGRFGTAQSTFQVGGNTGSALGPLIASLVILPFGQTAVGWLAIAAIAAIWLLGPTLSTMFTNINTKLT